MTLRCSTRGGSGCKSDTNCKVFEFEARGFQFFQVHIQLSIGSKLSAILRRFRALHWGWNILLGVLLGLLRWSGRCAMHRKITLEACII